MDLESGDGTLARIDARTQSLTATISLGTPGEGGDIAVGGGMVWTTVRGVPLSAVDASTGRLRCQWIGNGGDSLGVAHDSLWLINCRAGELSRIDLRTVLGQCGALTSPAASPGRIRSSSMSAIRWPLDFNCSEVRPCEFSKSYRCRCPRGGEVGRVITGGVIAPRAASMFECQQEFQRRQDGLRGMLLSDPRGSVECGGESRHSSHRSGGGFRDDRDRVRPLPPGCPVRT